MTMTHARARHRYVVHPYLCMLLNMKGSMDECMHACMYVCLHRQWSVIVQHVCIYLLRCLLRLLLDTLPLLLRRLRAAVSSSAREEEWTGGATTPHPSMLRLILIRDCRLREAGREKIPPSENVHERASGRARQLPNPQQP